jgi:hypothetical protein
MKPALLSAVRIVLVLSGLLTVAAAMAMAQQPNQPAQQAPPEQPANPGAAAHYDRIAAAKTVFLKNAGGNDIPFNVISRNFEGWGHYLLVDSPDNADLVIEIRSPGEDEKKDKDSGSTKFHSAGQQSSQPSPPPAPIDVITFTVYDKNKKVLWIGREQPKFAVRHKAEDEHLLEAAQRLFTRFHDRIEPPVKP